MFLKFLLAYLCLMRYPLKTQSLHNKEKSSPSFFDGRKAVSKKGRYFKIAFFCKYIDGLSQLGYGMVYLYFSNDHSECDCVENLVGSLIANDSLLGNAP